MPGPPFPHSIALLGLVPRDTSYLSALEHRRRRYAVCWLVDGVWAKERGSHRIRMTRFDAHNLL